MHERVRLQSRFEAKVVIDVTRREEVIGQQHVALSAVMDLTVIDHFAGQHTICASDCS